MDHSLTESEKRFVLAEMIKASKINVDALAMFIKSSDLEANWLNMQLPFGRNMNQCMQAAEQLGVHSSLKRRLSSPQTDFHPKRVATLERPDYSYPVQHYSYPSYQSLAPNTISQAPLLPRPSSRDSRAAPSPPKPEPPKKRGRPSRADKAKRDLQPLLPRLPPPSEGSHFLHSAPVSRCQEYSPAASVTNRLAPSAPKDPEAPTLLASPVSAARPITPPEAYVPTAVSSASPQRLNSADSPRAVSASDTAVLKERPRPVPGQVQAQGF